MKLLFVCSQNRMRSPTAEHLLQGAPGYAVRSAGLAPSSRTPVSKQLITWANLIFVMEPWHSLVLEQDFSKALKGKRVICLNIPDEYQYMEPELVHVLKTALAQHIDLPESV